ncbi:hypothetical protein MVEN_01538700 [Mycena venus]|uniref:Uncharacterized protein n=1 Tax=Mycena venus TaxID=2733690 RepID=A0A8H6XWW1_9AGAR|nr:hypothetical protein MVEN_01538700 [Mycena venus]
MTFLLLLLPILPTSTPSMRQRNAGYSSLLETPPPPPSSPCRPSTSPARAVNGNLNRLSTASIASLPFPLPIPPGLGSEAEWEIDPFAATPYSFPSGGLQSKWSPDSSTLSLVHHSGPPDAGPKRDQEKQKGDKPQPTKLKELLGRLSINRNPTTSGFHFRSQSANISRDVAVVVTREQKSRRRDTMMTFDEFIFIDEEDPSSLVEDITARNDGTNILRTPTIRPISCIPEAADQDVRLVDADALRLDTGDEAWHGQVECSVSTTSPTWTDSSPRSTQASIPKYKDVDGIVASQDKSIIASVENTPSCCLDGSISSLSSTMRTPTPNALASYTFSNTPSLKHSRPKPRSAQARTLAIPPSPCAPPPHPPSYLPPLAPDSFPDLDFPSPPTLAQHLTSASPLAAGVMEMQRQSVSPPSPSTRRFPPFALSEVSSLQRQKPNSVGDTFSVKKPPAVPPTFKAAAPARENSSMPGSIRSFRAMRRVAVKRGLASAFTLVFDGIVPHDISPADSTDAFTFLFHCVARVCQSIRVYQSTTTTFTFCFGCIFGLHNLTDAHTSAAFPRSYIGLFTIIPPHGRAQSLRL